MGGGRTFAKNAEDFAGSLSAANKSASGNHINQLNLVLDSPQI